MSDTCKVITLASILASQAYFAQQGRAQQFAGEEDGRVVLALQQGGQGGKTSSRSTITQNDNNNSLRVEIVDGNVESVTRNGEKLGKDRYRYENGKLEVLDKEGNVLHELQVGMVGEMPGVPAVPVLPAIPLLDDWFVKRGQVMVAPNWPGEAIAQPKVRMGIMMAADGEAEAVIVSGVTEGSPAEKAGLKVGDVIERIDGKRVVTQQDLRDALLNKEPGDKVVLRIERDRDEQEISVELVKAPEAEEENGFQFGLPGNVRSLVMIDREQSGEQLAQAQKQLQAAIEELTKDQANVEGAKAKLEEALAGLRAVSEELAKLPEGVGMNMWGQQFGDKANAWGEDFGRRMERMGDDIAKRFENRRPQMENQEMRREVLRERRDVGNPDAETRELRNMLKAMQDRLDRLEQQEKKPD